jgi:hypothetical protein
LILIKGFDSVGDEKYFSWYSLLTNAKKMEVSISVKKVVIGTYVTRI